MSFAVDLKAADIFISIESSIFLFPLNLHLLFPCQKTVPPWKNKEEDRG
jgi:hypothetical protein